MTVSLYRDGSERTSWIFTLYLTIVFVAFVGNLDHYLAGRGLLKINTLILITGAVAAFFGATLMSNSCQYYAMRYFFIIRENAIVIGFFFMWVFGHLFFLGSANLPFEEVDYTIIFPIFQFSLFMFGLALPIMLGFDSALAVAVRITIIAIGSSILVDAQFPGFFSNSANRGAGFLLNANSAAFILCLNLAVLAMSKKSRLDALIVMLGSLAVLFTLSRSGIVQLALVLLTYMWVSIGRALQGQRRFVTWARLGIIALGIVALFGFFEEIVRTMPIFKVEGVEERIDKLMFRDSITEDRFRPALNAHYLGLAMAHPVAGYGTYYTKGVGLAAAPFQQGPHNMYLRVWVDHGMWGLVAYLGILVSAMWLFVRRRYLPGYTVIALVVFYGFFSHTIIDTKAFLIVLGVVLGSSVIDRKTGIDGAVINNRKGGAWRQC